jgi:hypothetical protein
MLRIKASSFLIDGEVVNVGERFGLDRAHRGRAQTGAVSLPAVAALLAGTAAVRQEGADREGT